MSRLAQTYTKTIKIRNINTVIKNNKYRLKKESQTKNYTHTYNTSKRNKMKIQFYISSVVIYTIHIRYLYTF